MLLLQAAVASLQSAAVVRMAETEDINQMLQQPPHLSPPAARPGTAALQRCSA